MDPRKEMDKLEQAYGKLSKKYLMELEEGLFLMSNVLYSPTNPCFAEAVAPLSEREAQWKRIKEARANNRNCTILKSKSDFPKWQKCAEELYGK